MAKPLLLMSSLTGVYRLCGLASAFSASEMALCMCLSPSVKDWSVGSIPRPVRNADSAALYASSSKCALACTQAATCQTCCLQVHLTNLRQNGIDAHSIDEHRPGDRMLWQKATALQPCSRHSGPGGPNEKGPARQKHLCKIKMQQL